MNTWQQTSKLVELRSKTDRQLVELVTRTLEAAHCFARAGEFQGRAERACDEVRRLLPCLPRAERRRAEARLAEIDALLCPRAQAACF
jgi:hypothetical protein